jgi:hypothetical protein
LCWCKDNNQVVKTGGCVIEITIPGKPNNSLQKYRLTILAKRLKKTEKIKA